MSKNGQKWPTKGVLQLFGKILLLGLTEIVVE